MENQISSYSLFTKDVFYISKALKIKYNIPITTTIRKTNFAEFYESLDKPTACESEVVDDLIKLIKNLNEDVYLLIQTGKNIVDEEHKFKNLNWSNIISGIKTELNLTDPKLGEEISCDRRLISDWEIGKRIPNYSNCKKLIEFILGNNLILEKLHSYNGKKHTYKNKYTNVDLLILTPEIAEFIGIINGDGTVTKSGTISITGNALEDIMHHRARIRLLCKKILDKEVNSKIKTGGVIKSQFGSLYFMNQLKNLGVPIGRKINLFIPNLIMNNNELLKHYLRGLFDTDGTVCRRNKFNIRVGYGSFNVGSFTRNVFLSLKKIGFDPKFMCYGDRSRVEIINDLDVIRFFKIIGSSNYSKIARFIYWRLNKHCPSYDYYTMKSKLKEQNINVEKFGVPFTWSDRYINSLYNPTRKILIKLLEDDYFKFKINKFRKDINWQGNISLLKNNFKLITLKKAFNCDHKTMWQWQTGFRVPNLNMCEKLRNFAIKTILH